MWLCKPCGRENPDSTRTCRRCGTRHKSDRLSETVHVVGAGSTPPPAPPRARPGVVAGPVDIRGRLITVLPSGADDTVFLGLTEDIVQVRSLGGEHFDDLVEIAVAGCPGDTVVACQRGHVDVLAEPAQPEHRLLKAGQCPTVAAGAPRATLSLQQPANVLGEWARNIEDGTIGDTRASVHTTMRLFRMRKL